MSDRISRADIEERCANLNRRLRDGRSNRIAGDRQVFAQGRNGYIGLDEYVVTDRPIRGLEELPARFESPHALDMVRTLTTGTKREVGEFLHAMMVGIDLARVNDDVSYKPNV